MKCVPRISINLWRTSWKTLTWIPSGRWEENFKVARNKLDGGMEMANGCVFCISGVALSNYYTVFLIKWILTNICQENFFVVNTGPFKLLLYPKPDLNFSKYAPMNHLKKTGKIKWVYEKLGRYKSSCLRYVTKMNDIRLPK